MLKHFRCICKNDYKLVDLDATSKKEVKSKIGNIENQINIFEISEKELKQKNFNAMAFCIFLMIFPTIFSLFFFYSISRVEYKMIDVNNIEKINLC